MLEIPIDDRQAWTTTQVNDSRPWVLPLAQSILDLVEPVVNNWRSIRGPVTDMQLTAQQSLQGRELLGDLEQELEAGCGFVLLDRLPLDRFTSEEATLAYWLIGQMIGRPMVQNVKGTLLYVGADYTKGARFSVTNARTSFHTDGAFQPQMADYIALLCLRTARSGGENQVISAYSLHKVLVERHRELMATMYGPFNFDRRGEIQQDELPTSPQSIFRWDHVRKELTMRYLHYYILEGHRKAGVALTILQQEAIAAVEQELNDPCLAVEFSIEPGQMLFSNNHWTLHNRNAFEDHQDPRRRRHYVRLWMRRCCP